MYKLYYLMRIELGHYACIVVSPDIAIVTIECDATVWDPYQTYFSDMVERVQRHTARFVKRRNTRYSSVSDMLDELA